MLSRYVARAASRAASRWDSAWSTRLDNSSKSLKHSIAAERADEDEAVEDEDDNKLSYNIFLIITDGSPADL